MDSTIIWGIVRSLLMSLGGIFVTSGYVSNDQLSVVVGAVIGLATVIASVVSKVQAKKKLEVALELPGNSSMRKLNDVMAKK